MYMAHSKVDRRRRYEYTSHKWDDLEACRGHVATAGINSSVMIVVILECFKPPAQFSEWGQIIGGEFARYSATIGKLARKPFLFDQAWKKLSQTRSNLPPLNKGKVCQHPTCETISVSPLISGRNPNIIQAHLGRYVNLLFPGGRLSMPSRKRIKSSRRLFNSDECRLVSEVAVKIHHTRQDLLNRVLNADLP